MNPEQQPTVPSSTTESANGPVRQNLPDQKLPHEGLMTEVLAATLTGDGTALTKDEWEAIEQVARAYPPETEVDLGIVSQLVSAFLASRFPALVSEKVLFNRMSLRLSGALWSHPVGKQRLIRFWELISGHVRS